MKDELENLIGQNVIYALAEIIFSLWSGCQVKLKDGTKYKITVEGAIDD